MNIHLPEKCTQKVSNRFIQISLTTCLVFANYWIANFSINLYLFVFSIGNRSSLAAPILELFTLYLPFYNASADISFIQNVFCMYWLTWQKHLIQIKEKHFLCEEYKTMNFIWKSTFFFSKQSCRQKNLQATRHFFCLLFDTIFFDLFRCCEKNKKSWNILYLIINLNEKESKLCKQSS
jgi:hypothetical protein